LLRQTAYACGVSEGWRAATGGVWVKVGIVFRQLGESRRYRRGRGVVPGLGRSGAAIRFAQLEAVGGCAGEEEADRVADLLSRFVRHRIEMIGKAGYYDWPMFDALLGLWCQVAAVSWRSRLHAAVRGGQAIGFEDVAKAVGEVDRAAGRARGLGHFSERVRSRFLVTGGGFDRLVATWPFVRERGGQGLR